FPLELLSLCADRTVLFLRPRLFAQAPSALFGFLQPVGLVPLTTWRTEARRGGTVQRKNRQTCENVRSRSYKLICLPNLRTAIQAFFKKFSTVRRPRNRGRIVLDSARVGHKYGEIIFMSTRYGRIDAGKKWIRWRIHFGQVDRLCWILVCAISLAGCSERSQELEERVTQLQKELNRTQDELRSTRQSLNATNEELARLKAASASASTSTTTSAVSSAAPAS